jgi:hypothetical protein
MSIGVNDPNGLAETALARTVLAKAATAGIGVVL